MVYLFMYVNNIWIIIFTYCDEYMYVNITIKVPIIIVTDKMILAFFKQSTLSTI